MDAASQILKNYNLFVDGRGYAGNVDEVQLPNLALILEQFRGGGMDASIPLDMGMEALELSFKLSRFSPEVLRLFGLANGSTVPLVFRGALQSADGVVVAVVINATGRITSVTTDPVRAGEKPLQSYTVGLTYYRYQQAGETVHEIDIPNMKRIINGVDQLAAIRAAIGV